MSHSNNVAIFSSHWNLNIIWNIYELFMYSPKRKHWIPREIKTSSYCSEQARHLSSSDEWIIITYRFPPRSFSRSTACALPPVQLSPGQWRAWSSSASVSHSPWESARMCDWLWIWTWCFCGSELLCHFQETSVQSSRF